MRQDIAEEIAGYNHAKLSGVADKFHDQGVDIDVAGIDVRIVILYFIKYSSPKFVSVGQRIRFVAHANAVEMALAGVFESVADDSLYAPARVHVLLYGHLMRSAALKLTADADVEAFGVLAQHYKVDIVRIAAA